MRSREELKACRRLVVKVGTNILTEGESLARKRMANIVAQLARLRNDGRQVLLVSSGAIALGKRELKLDKKAKGIPFKQVLASVGQAGLMQFYRELFRGHGIKVAQALLARSDMTNRLGYLNARNTLLALLELGVVPVVNENDVVAVEELEGTTFGDNDSLSAMVANLIDADLLLILSDVGGLYTRDPEREAGAQLISEVKRIDANLERLAGGSSGEGTGGMRTKLEAAKLATASGVAVVIADGREPGVVLRVVAGEPLGTFFPPTVSRLESRKRWMLGLPVRGKVVVDYGAKVALQQQNRSLLPAGVVGVEREFERGDVVAIYDLEGEELGRGIVNYSSQDMEKIKGHHSDEIPTLLGESFGEEVIHRDNLVLL